jgi:hypothetical protein
MPKAYERLEPFDDPIEEKKRLNAIKAKEARDRKKVEGLSLKKKLEISNMKKKKYRKRNFQYKLILKSHNIKIPFESSDDDSDSDMEMESNVKMVKKNTVSQQKRYDQIPEPVEID